PFINRALELAQVPSHFVRGLRVTSPESLPIIEKELSMLGKILAYEIGGAIALTGRDAKVIEAGLRDPELGLVGDVSKVNESLLKRLISFDLIPVISCIAADEAGGDHAVLNVNADSVAGAIAGAFHAPVIFLSDVPGVLDNPKDPDSLLTNLSAQEIRERIADGRIAGGMIPKVEAALEALEHGASFATIADGRQVEGLSAALQAKGGTQIHP
ncbi:MAG: acetylglutamate kinase, partial [Deinococcales bacterium]